MSLHKRTVSSSLAMRPPLPSESNAEHLATNAITADDASRSSGKMAPQDSALPPAGHSARSTQRASIPNRLGSPCPNPDSAGALAQPPTPDAAIAQAGPATSQAAPKHRDTGPLPGLRPPPPPEIGQVRWRTPEQPKALAGARRRPCLCVLTNRPPPTNPGQPGRPRPSPLGSGRPAQASFARSAPAASGWLRLAGPLGTGSAAGCSSRPALAGPGPGRPRPAPVGTAAGPGRPRPDPAGPGRSPWLAPARQHPRLRPNIGTPDPSRVSDHPRRDSIENAAAEWRTPNQPSALPEARRRPCRGDRPGGRPTDKLRLPPVGSGWPALWPAAGCSS